jgi:apolipoprotein N-acyltransferase
MDWNEIQNFSSNIVFGILLFAMITYWVNLSLFNDSNLLTKIGRFSTIIANYYYFLFFVLVG